MCDIPPFFDVRCDCFVPTRVCHDSGVTIGDVDGYDASILCDITHCAILAVERGHRCTDGVEAGADTGDLVCEDAEG